MTSPTTDQGLPEREWTSQAPEDVAAKITEIDLAIAELDVALIAALADRASLTHKVGKLKALHDLPALDPSREAEKFQTVRALARECQIDPEMVVRFFALIMSAAIKKHQKIAAGHVDQSRAGEPAGGAGAT